MRRPGRRPERLLATLLFTDIVGSTQLAARIGDRGWKALVARHNATVRRELRRFGGRELDTAGDGFFALFDRPAQAIDCAWATIDALKQLDITIRAGIHTGEVEVMGDKVGGIAVHAASRVLGLAGPGQILVTGLVRDLVAGSEIRFVDEGVRELRGVPGEWRLFAVSEAATDRALPVEAVPEPAARRRSQAPFIALAAMAAVAVAVGIGFALTPRSAPPVVPRADSVVRIDAATGRFLALASVDDPTGLAVDPDAVWALSLTGRTVNRIDRESGAVAPIGLPAGPTGIAAGGGAIWITTGFGTAGGSGGVVRVGTATRTVEATIPLGDGVGGITVADTGLFVVNRLRNTITRIDLTTRAPSGEATVGDDPVAVVVGEGSVWVANEVGRTVSRLDPGSLASRSEIALADAPSDLAVGFGRLWVISSRGGTVTVIDTATSARLQTVELPGQPYGIATDEDAVWVVLGSGAVVRIDPDDPPAFTQTQVGGALHDVASDGSSVWVSIRR